MLKNGSGSLVKHIAEESIENHDFEQAVAGGHAGAVAGVVGI